FKHPDRRVNRDSAQMRSRKSEFPKYLTEEVGMYRSVVRSLAMAVLTISSLMITWPANADGRDGGDDRGRGAVFVMTNSTNPVRGNEVAMHDRAANGDLSLIGFFPTGDLSTGNPQLGSGPAPTAQVFKIASGGSLPLVAANLDGLGSQNSLILS